MAIETYELHVCGLHDMSFNEVVMHWQGTGADPADTYANAKSLVDGFRANIEAAWLAAMPTNYEISEYQARRVLPKRSMVYRVHFPRGTLAGTDSPSTGAVQQLCPCIDLIPAMGTKSMGRIYLPTVGAGNILNNTYQAGYQAIITTLITAILTAFSQAGIAWVKVVLSRKLGTVAPAVSARSSPRIGYQKRRRAPLAE